QTGAITLGTSSQTTNGLTTGINITNTGGSFVLTPTLSGILSVSGGGTGTSTAPALNQLLIGNGAGGYNYVATSSLGLANGTVTSIATNNGLTGGTITSSGTIGLNTANLAANILTYWDGSNLHATSSPTVGYIIATSTTASQFPYASTTAITATTASTTNLIVSGLGGVSTRCLQVGPDGTVSANSAACGTGSGSGNATWSTTTSSVSGELVNYSNNNSDIVAIGGTATTTAKYWFDPNALVASFSGKVGIGTTSPYAALSVVGSTGIVADHYSATNTNATSTFAGNVAISGSPTVYASNNSLSLGVTSDSLSSVLASGSGSLAMGYGLTLTQGGSVQATGTASFAGGVSVGNSSSPGLIGAGGGGGSLAYGYATNGGTIGSWGSGSISLGAVSTGKIISNNSGSVALGYSTGGSMISSGLGSFVGGYQLGNSHDIVSSGNGSFAFGNNMTASGNYSTAFGSGFTNNVANSFMIGYSSTPTLTVNSTNVGIGTTSPYANLSVNALNGSANTTLFAVASSTANSTTTLFAIGNTGIITSNASATSTFAAAIKAPCFTTDGTTCLGGGTGSGTVNTGTQGQIAFYNSNTNAVTGTSSLFIAQNGNVGIGGTTTPWTTLSVTGASDLGNFALAGYFNATNTNATSTFAGGLTIGNNGLVYDSYSGVTTISSLQTGAMRFDTDAGVISWTDLPIDSSAPNGTTESYSANLNGSPMLTIYGQADGAGNIINPGVGIGTTSPFTTFAVQGNSYFSGSLTAGNVTATGTASTTNLIVSNSATIGTLSGLLYGTNGSVGTIATSSFNLSIPLASTTGILAVNQGGTGTSSAPALNQLLIGNGAGGYNYVATSSLGLANGTVTSIATNNGLTGGTITSSGTIGLNTANLAANILTYWDGSNLHATSSPTVGYITATSSTATSTFAGNVAIGTGDVFANNTSLALGTVNSGAQISAISKFGGNIAGGYAFKGATAGIISATGTGAIAFGAAQGATNPATLGSGGQASMAFGEAYNGGNLYSTGIGSFGFGYANTGNILSSGNGSFAGGLADNSSRNVIASGYGSFAMGYAHNGSVLASNNGSFAAGYANTGNITSSGIDSFAFGDNLTA
ncbi:MAG: hypothetical protein KGI66_04175, partial [Patescibacteria group bacterium]|nr:hypothetical protein [Patescibacteria group bacterium]